MKNLITLSAVCAAALVATAAVAAPVTSMSERSIAQGSYGTILAREAEPGDDRGRKGNDDGKGHKAIEQSPATTTAKREAEQRGNDDGAGHKAIEQQPMTTAKREAEQRGNDDGAGHKAIEQQPMTTAKREAEKRGNDDGAGHKATDEAGVQLLARAETSHGGKRRPAGKRGV